MEEIKKGGTTPEKAEEKEAIATLTHGEYNRLDSIFTRIVGTQDDLQLLISILEKSGMRAKWAAYRLDTVNDAICHSISSMEKILYGEVK